MIYLSDRIAIYERRSARGLQSAEEHEHLREEIAYVYGEASAEFFDREGMMPYWTSPRLPWPMRPSGRSWFVLSRVLLTAAALIVGLYFAPGLGVGLWSLLVPAATAAAGYLLGTLVPLLFRPRDLARRRELVEKYNAIAQAISASGPLVEPSISPDEALQHALAMVNEYETRLAALRARRADIDRASERDCCELARWKRLAAARSNTLTTPDKE